MSLTKLAVDGGKPIRSQWLPYGRQNIEEEDIRAVEAALRKDIITRGPSVSAFESAVADFVKMPYAVAFSSATAGLHAVMAMYKKTDDFLMVTSPITFCATANAARYVDGKIHFHDVEEATMNLDAKSLQIPQGTNVVTAVDFAGNPCDYVALRKIQSKGNFKIVSDAAHSLGASFHGEPAGAQADASVFSFHPVKSITTAEGGMVVVRDKAEYDFLRMFRDHGIRRTDTPGFYAQEILGYNFHITDLQCALGLSQLKRLPRFVKRRREVAQFYIDHWKDHPLIQLPQVTTGAESSWHLFPIRINFSALKVDRSQFLKALHAENIGANVHYIPVYFHPYYERLGFQKGICPNAERVYAEEISLPIFPSLTENDMKDVCRAVDKLLEAYKAV